MGRKYVMAAAPVGHPKTAAICGSPNCNEPAMVWLDQDERAQYLNGQRVFKFATNVVKVKVV
jgi:hypothetical protein